MVRKGTAEKAAAGKVEKDQPEMSRGLKTSRRRTCWPGGDHSSQWNPRPLVLQRHSHLLQGRHSQQVSATSSAPFLLQTLRNRRINLTGRNYPVAFGAGHRGIDPFPYKSWRVLCSQRSM